MRKALPALLLLVLALAAAACGNDDEETAGGGTTTTGASCDKDSLELFTPGQLTNDRQREVDRRPHGAKARRRRRSASSTPA